MREALDLKAAAKLVGISVHTLRALTRRGRITHYRVGRRIVYDRADLERYLERCRVPAREEDAR